MSTTPDLPKHLESKLQKKEPFVINDDGKWIILNDVHIPHHDDDAVNSALRRAKKLNVSGILLNGDILDSAEISDHAKHVSQSTYQEELRLTEEFLKHLRSSFKNARIVYKLGNHEERLEAYVMKRAPALAGSRGLDIGSFLNMKNYGVEIVQDKRIVKMGKLNVLHGHEHRGGGGVNVARWLFLACGGGVAAVCGHFHKTSEHQERNLTGFQGATWSIGCSCNLNPHWCSENKWNHGFGELQLARDGDFHFENHRVFPGGRVY